MVPGGLALLLAHLWEGKKMDAWAGQSDVVIGHTSGTRGEEDGCVGGLGQSTDGRIR